MSSFTLDTTGTVSAHALGYAGVWSWSDLSPFVQGYVGAMFAGAYQTLDTSYALDQWDAGASDALAPYRPRFSDLDPSALALILRDCEAASGIYFSAPRNIEAQHNFGALFWRDRQARSFRTSATRERFPPLHPYLSDEGRVCLRKAV